MHLADKTVMLLGGSGLVGHAVARRVLAEAPRRLVLVALFEGEVKDTAAALAPHRGKAEIAVEWGNVFLPAAIARHERGEILGDGAQRTLVIQDQFGDLTDEVLERNLLYQLLMKYRPDAVVDSINTATAFAYQDIFQSARDLLAASRAGTLDRAQVEQHILTLTMPQLIRHVQIITEALKRAGTAAYVKVGTSGTGGMGFNIPYTHSEERPSRTLLTKSAVAGAHSLLLFLLGRTPEAPAVVEIKPTATIAWREMAFGPIRRKGKPLPLVDCPVPVAVADAFGDGAKPWKDQGKSVQGVFIDVGENGLFAKDEFATVTALGQMEFITPEEVADYVIHELQGRPTGRDVIAALDGATAGPTYRAGLLRSAALGRLEQLEKESGTRSVGYEMLGPPRLTKMLYEAYVLSKLKPSVRALAAADGAGLAVEAEALLAKDTGLRAHILSVGIPILCADGARVYRGSLVVVPPPAGGEPLAAAPRGWVDLRPASLGAWVKRAQAMLREATARGGARESGSDVDWTALGADDPVDPPRFATWVFSHEDKGERIKR
ncbi:MAG TPA: hypothetical protein VJN62_11790 [Gemmatimonadales bacterium]|nr:hypothetical protein [Gemmatimonadales bacterium]